MSRIAVSPNPKIRTVTITTDDRPHYQSTVDDVDCDPTRINPHTPFVVRHPTTSPQKARPPACKPLPPLGLGICECKMPRELHETATQQKNNNLLLCPGWPSVRLLRHVDVRPSGPSVRSVLVSFQELSFDPLPLSSPPRTKKSPYPPPSPSPPSPPPLAAPRVPPW